MSSEPTGARRLFMLSPIDADGYCTGCNHKPTRETGRCLCVGGPATRYIPPLAAASEEPRPPENARYLEGYDGIPDGFYVPWSASEEPRPRSEEGQYEAELDRPGHVPGEYAATEQEPDWRALLQPLIDRMRWTRQARADERVSVRVFAANTTSFPWEQYEADLSRLLDAVERRAK